MYRNKRSLTGIALLILCITPVGSGLALHERLGAQTAPPQAEANLKASGKISRSASNSLTKSVLLLAELDNDRVQEELKLTENQLVSIQKVRKDIRAKHKKELEDAGFKGPHSPPHIPGQPKPAYRKVEAKIDAEVERELLKALPNILKENQVKRLWQISLQEHQLMDLGIFLAPEVKEKLKLTKEQEKKVVAHARESYEAIQKKMYKQSVRFDMQGVDSISLNDILIIVKTAREKLIAHVFADEQKKIWKELLGKPFSFGWDAPVNEEEGKGK